MNSSNRKKSVQKEKRVDGCGKPSAISVEMKRNTIYTMKNVCELGIVVGCGNPSTLYVQICVSVKGNFCFVFELGSWTCSEINANKCYHYVVLFFSRDPLSVADLFEL